MIENESEIDDTPDTTTGELDRNESGGRVESGIPDEEMNDDIAKMASLPLSESEKSDAGVCLAGDKTVISEEQPSLVSESQEKVTAVVEKIDDVVSTAPMAEVVASLEHDTRAGVEPMPPSVAVAAAVPVLTSDPALSTADAAPQTIPTSQTHSSATASTFQIPAPTNQPVVARVSTPNEGRKRINNFKISTMLALNVDLIKCVPPTSYQLYSVGELLTPVRAIDWRSRFNQSNL